MSNESLDNLFKKGLSKRNVAFDMESWRKMEQMLPAEKKAAGFSYGTVLAVVGVIVILTSSVLLWNTNSSRSELGEPSFSELSTKASLNVANDIAENTTSSEPATTDSEMIESNNLNAVVDNENLRTTQGSANLNDGDRESNTSIAANRKLSERESLSKTNASKENRSPKNAFFAQNDGFESLRVKDETQEAISMEREDDHFVALSKISSLESMNSFSLDQDEHTLFAEMGDAKLPRLKKNEFGIIGGLSINPSLVALGQNSISGCEVFGVTYQRYFKGGLSLNADLLYAPRNEVNAIKTFDRKIYGFGSISEQTKIESQRLVYLELPVMINFNAGNHNFMGGASISYLVTGQYKVSTEYTNATESIVEDEMKWGTTDGFNSHDFSVVAGYEYSIKPKWNVGMRLNYGLTDVTNNDYFGNDSFDNNVQFRVYLKYSPFQF